MPAVMHIRSADSIRWGKYASCSPRCFTDAFQCALAVKRLDVVCDALGKSAREFWECHRLFLLIITMTGYRDLRLILGETLTRPVSSGRSVVRYSLPNL
ncbi:hypothetical protein AVEN_44303-1 [Araneus ventricosus]|uniref:Uncharacterized protein n=1 Tax=Araneus ventricosus TaxID=182803 RepID=A0A4Y2DPH3_ARAVE|nr:hypothetical protein AVEN_44303-1 [Araneus ventricosus]